MWNDTCLVNRVQLFYAPKNLFLHEASKHDMCYVYHTAGLHTIFIQIYMDEPPGVLGVSKEPEGHKDQYLDVFLR